MSKRYQRGSLRRENRAAGDVWVWRYRVRGVMKQETYPVSEYKNKTAMWGYLEPSVRALNGLAPPPAKIAPDLNDVIGRYQSEVLPELEKTTQELYSGFIENHIQPKWGNIPLTEIKAADVQKWINGVKVSASTKSHIMTFFRRLFKKAMLWEMYPANQAGTTILNLVEVKGSTTRVKERPQLEPDIVTGLIWALQEPYRWMVLLASGLGLRVSEVVALKWEDFDLVKKTVTIRRAYTRGILKIVKTPASKATLPLGAYLLEVIKELAKKGSGEGFLFPSPVTDQPYQAGTILEKVIKPTAKKLGMPKVGWHDLRHGFRSWISSKAPTSVQKDMQRHTDIATTMIYGHTPVEDMRPYADEVAEKLRPKNLAAIH